MAFTPNHKDPSRKWVDIGGDLEASYDGKRYVDIRNKMTEKRLLFISKAALEKAINLFVDRRRFPADL